MSEIDSGNEVSEKAKAESLVVVEPLGPLPFFAQELIEAVSSTVDTKESTFCVVAGGSMISVLRPSHFYEDTDVFTNSTQAYDALKGRLNATMKPVGPEQKKANGGALQDYISGQHKVQVIYTPIKTAEELVRSFDIDVCKIMYDGNVVLATQSAIDGCRTGKADYVLKYVKPHGLNRIVKYARKGFDFDLMKISNRIYLQGRDEALSVPSPTQELVDAMIGYVTNNKHTQPVITTTSTHTIPYTYP